MEFSIKSLSLGLVLPWRLTRYATATEPDLGQAWEIVYHIRKKP